MLLAREELEKMNVLDPEIANYVRDHPRPPVDFSDYKLMRKGMEMMEKQLAAGLVPVPPETEFYHEITMRDGFKSVLKVHKPDDGPPGPLLVLCFGGGFVGGTVDQLTHISRALVKRFGATVVNISYRLAPEHKCTELAPDSSDRLTSFTVPIAQYDAWDSMKWIAENATGSILQSNPESGFIMGGVSAGAALTSAFSRVFQEQPLAHPLTGQWLSVPPVMESHQVPDKYKDYHISSEQFSEGAFLSKESRRWMQKFAEWDVTSPLRYAINSQTPVSGQPRTYFQVDGMDPLRDDALIYDEMLKEAGVPTKLDLYIGCPHAHFAMLPSLEISKKADIDTIVGFGWLLGKEASRDDASEALGL